MISVRCRLVKRFFVNDEQTLPLAFLSFLATKRFRVPFFYERFDPCSSSHLYCARPRSSFLYFFASNTPPYIPFMLLVFTFFFVNHFYTYYSRTNNKRSNFLPPHHKPISFLRRIIIRASVTPHRFSTTVHST